MKTVHDIVDKTLSFTLEHKDYKTIGVGRTDAKVSSVNYPLQIFLNETITKESFIEKFNFNAANDLKALSIEVCSVKFNIIRSEKIKTYHYYFNHGGKQHPFLAPLMVNFNEKLNIDLMMKAAKLYEGTHHFNKYCAQAKEKTMFERHIDYCSLEKNTMMSSSFETETSYVFIVKGKGFMRYQIRYMMAVLYEIGKGTMSLEDLKDSLKENTEKKAWHFIAPSSGLQLYDVLFLEAFI